MLFQATKSLASTLTTQHQNEWVNNSKVSELITTLNLETLTDNKDIALRLGWKSYHHTPGWWCSGVNPRTGAKLGTMHGQFKPDQPYKFPKSKKPSKYLSSKAQYDAICLDVGNPKFWLEIIQNISVPVLVTEGCKKAGAGLTHGYPTLALLGVEMGLIKGKLVNHLALFASPGREFILCFDADLVNKKNVQTALLKLAKVLAKLGCRVRVATWEESRGKGMDDFLANNGKDEFDVELARAQLIEEWESQFEDEDNGADDEDEKLPPHSLMSEELVPYLTDLRFCDKTHQWMEYETGHWSIATEESVFQRVVNGIEEAYPGKGFLAAYPSGVVKMLSSRLLFKNWPEAPRHLLPFRNGVLDLNTRQLLPHSPDYGFRNIIDRDHDLEATDWSVIAQWMDFVFENNSSQKHLLLCWYAALLRGMWELHRFALVVGEGGTGKSTAMKLGTEIVGKRSSHSLTLEALNSNSFQTGNIYDKRLVCINDADRYHGNLGIFKNITGGDEINVEWKFEKAFNAVYKGLVMATANNPVFTSNDSGLDRRLILFRFDRKVSEIDPRFAEKLGEQMSAFTNYLLSIPETEIIHTLLYKVDASGVREQNELEALLQTNSVADWLNARYSYNPNSELSIGSDKTNSEQLYGDYCDYTSKAGSASMSSKAFSPEVVRLGSGFLSKEKTKAGMVIRGLERNLSGGLIESIIQIKNINSAADPAHPAHPSPKRQNLVTEKVSAVKGQQQHPALLCNNTVQGVAGSNAQPSPTLHPAQSHDGTIFQPSKNPLVKGVQGQKENLRDREKIEIKAENPTIKEVHKLENDALTPIEPKLQPKFPAIGCEVGKTKNGKRITGWRGYIVKLVNPDSVKVWWGCWEKNRQGKQERKLEIVSLSNLMPFPAGRTDIKRSREELEFVANLIKSANTVNPSE